MNKLLPKQVYAGLFEIIKDKNCYYNSSVGADYSHLTDEGKDAVLQWISLMAPQMMKLHNLETDARAKQMVIDELKR